MKKKCRAATKVTPKTRGLQALRNQPQQKQRMIYIHAGGEGYVSSRIVPEKSAKCQTSGGGKGQDKNLGQWILLYLKNPS